ncbi:MAG: cytochrome P450 [Chloroflexota bacterium]|nr:cytochrome P450 [Chloroflexota bacterium]
MTTIIRPPGPPGLPFFGTMFQSMRDPLGFPMRNYRRYGEIVSSFFPGVRGVGMYGAAANRFILVDAVDNFLVAPLIDRLHARWLVGQGVLFIDEPAHKQQRRLILPAFHRKRLDGYQTTMVELTAAMLDRWPLGRPLDVVRAMHLLALEIAGRTLFQMDLSGDSNALSSAVAALVASLGSVLQLGLAQLPFDVPGGLGYGGSVRRGLTRIDAVLGAIIARHEQEGEDTGDVVSMLVAARDEAGDRLSPRQVRDHLLTLFVAGHETSANALAWALYMLAQYPAVTRKLLAELDHELHGAAPTMADLDRLPYLEQVTKEVLRLYPPAPTAMRTAREAFEWQDYRLPAGTVVFYSPFVSHRMPDAFPEPLAFRPERFDPAAAAKIAPYAYIPFAAGPRSCIGAPFAMLEIRTVLAMILQRFRLDLLAGQTVEMTLHTTLQPKYPILMRPVPQDRHTTRSPAAVRGNVPAATPGPA